MAEFPRRRWCERRAVFALVLRVCRVSAKMCFFLPAMEPALRQELFDRELEVIRFFEAEAFTANARFANYLDSRDEVMSVIVAKIPGLANPRSV